MPETTKLATAALALLLLGTIPADARSLGAIDSNQDGVIEYSEAKRGLKNMARVHFDKCDRNGDGVVDQSEYGCLRGIYDALYRRPK